jgi:hypothetical protein
MNRRTALSLSLLLGGLTAGSLRAQSPRRRLASRDRSLEPAAQARDDAEAPAEDSDLPSALPSDPGYQLRKYDISRYTKVASSQANPQKALIDWIFLRTGVAEWHGDRPAVLSASRTQLLAYHSPEVLKQVGEVVERFTNAVDDVLSVQVQFVAAVDTRWRYTVYSRLTHVGSGAQGQQIWTMRMEDAALVLSQMQIQQGFRKLAKERVEMINGQTLTVKTSEPRTFAGGLQRDGSAGLTFQPRADKIDEAIILKLSPLLTFEGNSVDAKIDLTVNTVRSFHRTKVVAPREIGPSEASIDVPEATQTRLEQTIRNWPLGQTLVISSGIHPGILDKKSGLFNLPIPWTYPTGTEVLVFLDVETAGRGRTTRESEPVPQQARGRLRPRGVRDLTGADTQSSAVDSDPDR